MECERVTETNLAFYIDLHSDSDHYAAMIWVGSSRPGPDNSELRTHAVMDHNEAL